MFCVLFENVSFVKFVTSHKLKRQFIAYKGLFDVTAGYAGSH